MMFNKLFFGTLVIFMLSAALCQIGAAQDSMDMQDTASHGYTMNKEDSSDEISLNPASDKDNNYAKPANEQFNQGNWEAGKKIVDEGLEKYPKYSDLWMLSGKYYLHYKNYDAARYGLHKALKYNPDNVAAKQILVNVEAQDRRYSAAIGYINDLLEVNPYWKGLWRKKILLYEKQGNEKAANHFRKRIMEIYPKDVQLKNDYIYYTNREAVQKAKNGDIDGAIKLHKEILNTAPNDPNHYVRLINDYLKAGDYFQALSYADRGLNRFPHNKMLMDKKAGILAHQRRYNDLLSFLKEKGLTRTYDYYLLQAARNAKNKEPYVLYGKVLARDPGNQEAFSYEFNGALSRHQYGIALGLIDQYRRAKGDTKDLELKELLVYKRMGNTSRADAMTIRLFHLYPNDYDLRLGYVQIKLKEAKTKMTGEQYAAAIAAWKEVARYGTPALQQVAETSMYNAYLQLNEYDHAMNLLNDRILSQPDNGSFYVKRAALFFKQKKYEQALQNYEKAIALSKDSTQKKRRIGGYSELMTQLVKSLITDYQYREAKQYVKRWLTHAPNNKLALHYAYNLAHLTEDNKNMLAYAKMGHQAYPDDLYFKLKLWNIYGQNPFNYSDIYDSLRNSLYEHPYNKDLIHAFSDLALRYGLHLIHNENKDIVRLAVVKLDTAIAFAPDNKELKYAKGLAMEKLKNYEAAYYYQGFHQPSEQEKKDFSRHLHYLNYRSKKNVIGLYHLRSRPGDHDAIRTISTFEYTHFSGKTNTYTGRAYYTGRTSGKGYQLQAEWSHIWNEKTFTKVNAAWGSQFFPEYTVNASVFRYVESLNDLQIELGAGYRKLQETDLSYGIDDLNMWDVVVGATKRLGQFRLNGKLHNVFLDGNWLYNVSADARYFLSSPKDFIMAVASVGTTPDIQLVDYQLYNGFDIINTMVGAGFGRMLYKNVSASILGTWYNYRYQKISGTADEKYRNLYNIYLTLNVAF